MQNLMINTNLACITILLACAVISDLHSRRIPNQLVLVGITLSTGLHLVSSVIGIPGLSEEEIYAPLLGMLTGGALLLPMYLMRACGAGDVKLMAMVGSFIGSSSVLAAALYTFLAGGLLSLAFMLAHGVARQTLSNVQFLLIDLTQRVLGGQSVHLAPLATTAVRLPYGVAIALGTLASFLWPL